MTVQQRINAFEKLGLIFKEAGASASKEASEPMARLLSELASSVHIYNGWFSRDNVLNVFESWGAALAKEHLEKWTKDLSKTVVQPRNVAVIMAGNIPLVGFHDMLSVLISGHILLAKTSGNDKQLTNLIAELIIKIEPGFKSRIYFRDSLLKGIDAIIATGSNNSARYFEYYFAKYPHIIRKSRHSAAVLDGSESAEEMRLLGRDVFQYFGLGCRSVSKLFIPEGYDLDNFFRAVFDFQTLLRNNKYANNYEYNKTVYLMQGKKLLDNGFLLLLEDTGIASPVAVVYYEYYKNKSELRERLNRDAANMQCIVSGRENSIVKNVEFGKSQFPELWDYADGVNTMKFLSEL